MAQNATVKINFPNHPFSDVMSEETLNNISREDVVSFYTANFTPNGSYLVVVGDITLELRCEIPIIGWANGRLSL